ncbi:MAG: IS1595 family transposase [Verrucomicrobia bacterium]|nr:IS1595 family transposase [Verrucomicrobiota bacterium]MCF7709358.1 IS1595 family transposase [Verrucomicrobiota bacterium]
MKATPENPYPKTFEEFLGWFQSDADCEHYLEWVRWPEGFACPHCGGKKVWRTDRGLIQCSACQHQTSVTVGTVFEGTRKPLLLWFHVMWLMMAQKTGLSARNLCETYGFGSYQTAWGWLQKLRSVMIRSGRERLCGRVEVDETYIGGQKEGARGRGAEGKTLVLVAVEGDSTKLGRVRFRCVPTADADNIEPFVSDYVKPGSLVITDGLPAYSGLGAAGFDYHPHVIATGGETARQELDHVHLVVSLLKRWLVGTHQGAVKPSHLQAYLDEFAFRFNRRLSTHRGKLFHRLIQQSVTLRPKPVKSFYVKKPQHVGGT